jgi:hypothetical protein
VVGENSVDAATKVGIVCPPVAAGQRVQLALVDALDGDWRVFETVGVSPAQMQRSFVDAPFVLGFKPVGAVVTLGVAAAKHGFPNLTMEYLEKLFVLAKVAGKRPAREAELV